MRKTLITCAGLVVLIISYVASDLPAALIKPSTAAPRIIITRANILPMTDLSTPEQVIHNQVIVIEHGVIQQISTKPPPANPQDTVIDAKGAFLLPGLIDAHIHLHDEAELAGYLAHGITGLRNMSGYPFHLAMAQRISRGELLAPELMTTSPILNSHGPNSGINQVLVDDKHQAEQAVEHFYKRGFTSLKIYSNLNKHAMESALATANKYNMAVTGHSPEGHREQGIPYQAPFSIPWEASVGRGFQTLEHIETVVWHALRDELNTAKLANVAKALLKGGDVLVPTLIAHRRLVHIAESKGQYLQQAGSDTINPLLTWFEQGSIAYWSEMDPAPYERPHADFFQAATGYLHSQGVPMLAGSDAGGFGLIPGLSLHEELALLTQSGMTAAEAIASATHLSAQRLGMRQQGIIAEGVPANIILIKSDPRHDITVLQQLEGMVVNGRWLNASDIRALHSAARDTSWFRSIWRSLQMLWYVHRV